MSKFGNTFFTAEDNALYRDPISEGKVIAKLLLSLSEASRAGKADNTLSLIARQTRMVIIEGLIRDGWRVFVSPDGEKFQYKVIPNTSKADVSNWSELISGSYENTFDTIVENMTKNAYS